MHYSAFYFAAHDTFRSSTPSREWAHGISGEKSIEIYFLILKTPILAKLTWKAPISKEPTWKVLTWKMLTWKEQTSTKHSWKRAPSMVLI